MQILIFCVCRLRDVLATNLEAPLYVTEPMEVTSRQITVDDVMAFPESLAGRHAAILNIKTATRPFEL